MIVLNGSVFNNGRFEKKDLRVVAGKFAEIADSGRLSEASLKEDGEQILDATDKYILPGLVDVHTHGRIGEDFSLATAEGLRKLLASYAECGVTSVIGTTMTNEPSLVEESLQVMGEYMQGQNAAVQETMSYGQIPCAKLLGIHMEGPFFGTEKKGAHNVQYLRTLDWEWFEKMQELSGRTIRLVTIDPNLSGTEGFIRKCCENGIKVSLGHTACNYETAVKAQQAGADHVAHLFNAMNSLHHREPGLVGAALDTGIYTELICDGIHLHPSVIRLMFATHPDKMILISDSIPAAGMSDGEYSSGGMLVYVKEGKAMLEDGTIAGSTISLFDTMVNAIRFGIPAEQAVNSATYLPAKSVGMENVVGSIAVGRTADFLVTDKEWRLEKVVCNCFRNTEKT